MANLTNGLLTGGLGVDLPACAMIITAKFNLGPCGVAVSVGESANFAAGGPVLQPGEIHNLYQPVKNVDSIRNTYTQPEYYVRPETPVKKNVVKLTFRFGEKETTKEYLVRAERLKIVVKLIDIVNRTKDKASIIVKGMKKLATRAKLGIKWIRNRKS